MLSARYAATHIRGGEVCACRYKRHYLLKYRVFLCFILRVKQLRRRPAEESECRLNVITPCGGIPEYDESRAPRGQRQAMGYARV